MILDIAVDDSELVDLFNPTTTYILLSIVIIAIVAAAIYLITNAVKNHKTKNNDSLDSTNE